MKRLLVLSSSAPRYQDWTHALGLTPRQAIHVSPHVNPKKYRGMSEAHTAIVWLEDFATSSALDSILAVYTGLGAPEFHHSLHDEIKAWLRS